MVTQVEIAQHVGLDVSSVNKILHRKPGPVFRKQTIQHVFRAARKLGYDFARVKHHHRRRDARRNISAATEIRIHRADGSLHAQGHGTINDCSPRGARVIDIQLSGAGLPIEPFTVFLRPVVKLGSEAAYNGRIVRLFYSDTLGFGIEFST